ncbi:ABC transporter ATP-binding protein [Georgenia sp. 10Sc9-8]|uniref:ABC transporter ATP-binding protein n=1 Tax=Georgenia halotolerans TaxID=3028317 RepID=A0ABT5U077_9MICO|nr:ABC transporter ATP-binding protein [Georgenia halotolerans]
MTASGLTVRDLVVTYDGTTTAVAGVDLDVAVGEVVALLGSSGSGKSSLMRAVAGLEPVAAGTVRWDGADVATQPVHRRGFGLMFQDGQLFPHRDVAGNVGYGLAAAGVPRDRRVARVGELLRLVGLEGYERRPVSTLSGGQAQRVALARSLAPEPRLLLLDEPLSSLDRSLREHLAWELRRILRATGTTAVYVTHDHDEAFTVADRVAVMDGGRLRQVAAPQELWTAPVDRAVAAFLGYSPFLPATVDGGAARTVLGPVAVPEHLEGTTSLQVGLGPGALLVGTEGVPATVRSRRFRQGRAEVMVDLPGGQRAHALAPAVLEPGQVVHLRLDTARAVVVPGGG